MSDNLAIMDLKDIREYLIECHYNVEAIDYAIKVLEERPQGKWCRDNRLYKFKKSMKEVD